MGGRGIECCIRLIPFEIPEFQKQMYSQFIIASKDAIYIKVIIRYSRGFGAGNDLFQYRSKPGEG